MKVLVLTISDRASRGEYEDLSGPAVAGVIEKGVEGAEIEIAVVPDDPVLIGKELEGNLDRDVILTTGGTGLGPDDITPEVTAGFCERLIPGIAEYLRRESCSQTVNAVLSRGIAGVRGKTLIVNLPGSVRGASFCAELLIHLLPHALKMMAGGGH